MWRNLQLFLDILELTTENIKNCLGQTVLKKVKEIKYMGTKLVLLIDFWDHIFTKSAHQADLI